MPRHYPAIDVCWPADPGQDAIDQLMAMLDDASPIAVEEIKNGCRAFFNDTADQERAVGLAQAVAPNTTIRTLEVSDESWAERSQAGLLPVIVGGLTIAPPWSPRPPGTDDVRWIVIEPSMGFGTGHHQTTRLCLRLLQRVPIDGIRVLDVGTGSGVLAIAAARLGARAVVGVDYDRDAIDCAKKNVRLNGVNSRVTIRTEGIGPGPHGDWDSPSLTPDMVEQLTQEAIRERARPPETPSGVASDLVLGNLTGATLLKLATSLARSITPGGQLIVSGFQYFEQDAVAAALVSVGFVLTEAMQEDDWVALRLTASPREPTATSTQ